MNANELAHDFIPKHERSPYLWMEIDLKVIQENYLTLQKFVSPAICSAVLKANAYGLGAVDVGKALFEAGCRDFWVAYVDEAELLKKGLEEIGGVPNWNKENKPHLLFPKMTGSSEQNVADLHKVWTTPQKNSNESADKKQNTYRLFVLNGPFLDHWCKEFYENKYLPVLNTLKNAKEWDYFAKSIGKKLPAVLHVDTGIRRLGLPFEEYETFKESDFKNIDWALFMSHPAAASQVDHPANNFQIERVKKIRRDFPDIKFSYADTSAVLLGKDLHFDMVRIGLGLYGVKKNELTKNGVTVYGTVLQVQDISPGSGVGYDWTFVSEKQRKIATVSCGYADGIFQLRTKEIESFWVKERPARILGRISMDLTVIDVTGIDVNVGDKVVVFGKDVDSMGEVSIFSGLSIYEILTGFNCRIRRIFV
jgi:alanine racemase